MALTSTKCNLAGSSYKPDYTKTYNPYTLIKNNSYAADIHLDNAEFYRTDENSTIREEILKIDTFESVPNNATNTNKCFRYYLRPNGLFLLTHRGGDMIFYQDGYVDVGTMSHPKDAEDHYYYKFDAEKAASLYNYVANYFSEKEKEEQEREAEKDKYNDIINSFDMDFIKASIQEQNDIEMKLYHFISEKGYRAYSYFNDDGSVKDMIQNADFRLADYTFKSSDYNGNYLNVEMYEQKSSWSFNLYEGVELATISRTITDKYNRSYSKKLTYTIDRSSVQSIMNKAFELDEQNNK